jgi:IS30 family transposase
MKDTMKRAGVKHFTWAQRNMMETLARKKWPFKKKVCWAELGRDMGRSARSVRNEYARGRVTLRGKNFETYEAYSAEKGQQAAEARHANKGVPMWLTNAIVAEIIIHIVDHHRSPAVALAKMRKEGKYKWLPCLRTLYYAIENGLLEIIRKNLPYGGKRRKTPKRGRRMAYARTPGKSISDRPNEAENRDVYGHWEMDTLVGPTGGSGACLLALTERAAREQIIVRMPDRTQQSVHRALKTLAKDDTRNPFATMKSITSDNGSEFWNFKAIENIAAKAGARRNAGLFYAHPSCPHERGSNENANRIIRRHLPKKTDFSHVPKHQTRKIEDEINNMERASFAWKTPLERKKKLLGEYHHKTMPFCLASHRASLPRGAAPWMAGLRPAIKH